MKYEIEYHEYDVVVVGAGGSGLRATVGAVETIVNTYLDIRNDGEPFTDTYRRLGMAPFKEALYGTD